LLPQAQEEVEPDFRHHPAASLPEIDVGGARVRLLVGSAFCAESPVRTLSPFLYAEAWLPAGCELPLPAEQEERAAFIVAGSVSCGDVRGDVYVEAPRMIVFAAGSRPVLHAESDTRLMLVGGAPLDGDRHLWWNFVSSSPERIERAKHDWAERRFAPVPGETEFIPLPER
jgi:redox-sensitive bicupin YhaK (pirin superfamily)